MKYHSTIDKLPLSIFMDCYCDNNLKSLIIEGDVDDFILTDAWMQIQEQYATALGNNEQRLFLKLLKEVNILNAEISQAEICLGTLRLYYTEQFAKFLNKLLKTDYKFVPQDWEAYNRQLDLCDGKLRGLEMHRDLKQHAYEEIEKKLNKQTGGVKPTREYFGRILNAMEEHFSISVDETILVNRFCDRIRRMSKPQKHGRR